MGMFDSVWVPCPNCEKRNEFQSKGGECILESFTLESAPPRVLLDLHPNALTCDYCGQRYGVDVDVRVFTNIYKVGDISSHDEL